LSAIKINETHEIDYLKGEVSRNQQGASKVYM